MTDAFEERLRRQILRAVAVGDEPATADRMAEMAMTSTARPARLTKVLAAVGSAGAVAATAVIVTVVGTTGHGGRQQPGDQPMSSPAGTCTIYASPSVPPTTVSAGQPAATGPKTQEQGTETTERGGRQPAACPPTSSTGAGTAPATPSYHP